MFTDRTPEKRTIQHFIPVNKIVSAVLLLTITALFLTPFPSGAVPAYPHPIEFRQPDGSTLTIRLRGDEKVNWAETPDGYSILVTSEGYYEYAVLDEYGDMVFSGVRVSAPGQRGAAEKAFLADLPAGLFYSKRQLEAFRQVWEMRKVKSARFPSTGERTLITILMQTPDVPFTKTQAEFDALFNQLNYTIGGATGSVRDYYLENSYGQFDLSVDVVGPYTAQHNMAHYGSTWAGARQLATEAVHLANPDVDYSDYDNNGDGWVEGIYMIFAGYGEEAGGGPNTIWSHAWNIDPVQLDGVWISRYACSPELRGNSGTNITRIGVIGHEFGHILGAPDFYDTDGSGSGGQYTGTGSWDMMAGGTWNNGGATPAHHNAYTKTHTYQWASPTILNQPTSITMDHAAAHHDSFYRINTNTPGEYYLLENRHQVGFDAAIPGEGLIIYHVHKEIPASGNSVNVGHPQKMYPVCAGSNTDPFGPPWTYGNINTAQTPFPGSTNQTSFSDLSTPSSLSWAGDSTHKPLTNITRHAASRTVSFDFMGDTELIADWMHWDDGRHEGSVGLGGGGIYQIAHRFEPADMEAFMGFMISRLRLYIGNVPSNAAIKVWQGSSQDSLVEVVHQEFTPTANSWVEVELEQPHLINPDLELWFGAEYDDPGANVFTASRDIITDHDGKGNLIRMDVEDHEAWVPLSNFNISGDWNIQARVVASGMNVISFMVAEGEGELTAWAGGLEIQSGHAVPQGEDLLFVAEPHTGSGIAQWTLNGEVVEGHTEDTLELENLSESIQVTVSFHEVFHLVDFYVDGQHGSLDATVDDEAIDPGSEVQQGSDILFIASPDPGYRVQQWVLNGTTVEGEAGDQLEINYLDNDISLVVSFEEAVHVNDILPAAPKVWPNPASSRLHIASDHKIHRVELIGLTGAVIQGVDKQAYQVEMVLEEIPSGSYHLRIHTATGTHHTPLLIVR